MGCFDWQGSYYSTHNKANFSDWLICQPQEFSLVEMLSSISQPICASSERNFYHIQPFNIHIQQASHISHMNLPTYSIRDMKKWPHIMRQMLAQESCDIWMIFQSFLSKTSTDTIHPIYFQKCISLVSKNSVEMRYSITNEEERLEGSQ